MTFLDLRYVLKNHQSGEETILHLTPEQEKDKTHFTDKAVSSPFRTTLSVNLSVCSNLESLELYLSVVIFKTPCITSKQGDPYIVA